MAFAWKPEIVRALHAAADAHGLERALVRAVCYVESRGKPTAVSPAGAKGLMQLMDGTAGDMGVADPFDPLENAKGGAKYLALMLRMFDGNVQRALAAYNWGPRNVQTKATIPGSVQKYAQDVLDRYHLERVTDPLAGPPAQPPAGLVCSFSCPRCGSPLAIVEKDRRDGT